MMFANKCNLTKNEKNVTFCYFYLSKKLEGVIPWQVSVIKEKTVTYTNFLN